MRHYLIFILISTCCLHNDVLAQYEPEPPFIIAKDSLIYNMPCDSMLTEYKAVSVFIRIKFNNNHDIIEWFDISRVDFHDINGNVYIYHNDKAVSLYAAPSPSDIYPDNVLIFYQFFDNKLEEITFDPTPNSANNPLRNYPMVFKFDFYK